MKFQPVAVFSLGVAIAAAFALALPVAAVAATPGVTYVTGADIVQSNVAGDPGWTTIPGNTFTSSTSGLDMSGTLSYEVATPIPTSTGGAVVAFAGSTTFNDSSGVVIFPEITLFDANGVDDLIFSFSAASLTDPTSQWYYTNPLAPCRRSSRSRNSTRSLRRTRALPVGRSGRSSWSR